MRSFSTLRQKYLVETAELADLLKSNSSDLRVLNCTTGPDAKDNHLAKRISASTLYYSIKDATEPGSKLPNTFPPTQVFTDVARKIGVRRTDTIICYDDINFSAARAAWMFRYFGAENVRVLDGGLTKWLHEGREVFNGPQEMPQEVDGDYNYEAVDESELIMDINTVHQAAYYITNKASNW